MGDLKVEIATLSYRRNAGRTDSKIIRLGLLVSASGLRPKSGGVANLLMLLAADRLENEVSSQMDSISRTLLHNPIDFFKREVDIALDEDPEHPLSSLARRLFWSIHVSGPAEIRPPKDLVDMLTKLAAARAAPSTKPVETLIGAHAGEKQAKARSIHRRQRLSPVEQGTLEHIADPDLRKDLHLSEMPPAWMLPAHPVRRHGAH